MPEELKDKDYKKNLGADICAVLFYKDPCPYCKTMKGVLEKFGKAVPDVKIFQINGLENPASAEDYGVERFPDLLFLKDGEIAGRQKGLINPQGLKKIYSEI